MFDKTYYYLISIEYLGYRFHGWQKQPNLKTLQFMIDRTLNYVLDGQNFKTLSSGRTDAKVSARGAVFELFLKNKPLDDLDEFLELFNTNLPQDIRALTIREVDEGFNVIQDVKEKEYLYLFAHGEKFHPFCAPIMTTILDRLDIEIMTRGAELFQGEHDFKAYCYQANDRGNYVREIKHCELRENELFQANFFPEKTYVLRVVGKGFMRNQIRLMMGTLINLGRHEITLEDIRKSLRDDSGMTMDYIAPASGLILNRIEFE
ncbi:MAG: tRNA pseudouridine(38-40) synthase TruA [Flavobacteriaceae bacterium]|nr:tRNA pseudouridine(38-40) synthase TruA [Flavobacteriaceae bacterium]